MTELRNGGTSQGSTLEDVFLDVVGREEAA
jgi:ABC-2 type transport system ATP-binding protein